MRYLLFETRLLTLFAALGSASCLDTTTEVCDDGRRCPPGYVCALAGSEWACIPAHACGDHRISRLAGEVCDDGNQSDGDGCSADCRSTETCGNGILDLVNREECDDDGETATCDGDCTVPVCGDGHVNPLAGEECEPGGPSTRCNADCTLPFHGGDAQGSAAREDGAQ